MSRDSTLSTAAWICPAGHVQRQGRHARIRVGQGLASAGIHPFRASPQGFLDQRPPDTAIGTGHQNGSICDCRRAAHTKPPSRFECRSEEAARSIAGPAEAGPAQPRAHQGNGVASWAVRLLCGLRRGSTASAPDSPTCSPTDDPPPTTWCEPPRSASGGKPTELPVTAGRLRERRDSNPRHPAWQRRRF
jgi:hypothetical protein